LELIRFPRYFLKTDMEAIIDSFPVQSTIYLPPLS
jgi:hypothetical protein